MVKIECELPENKQRLETGVVEVNDDWPGIFIRGDNAFAYSSYLINFISDPTNLFYKDAILSLAELLNECNENKEIKEKYKQLINELKNGAGAIQKNGKS